MCIKNKQNDGKQVAQKKETFQENQETNKVKESPTKPGFTLEHVVVSETQSEQPVETTVGNLDSYESCIDELIKKLKDRMWMKMAGYVFLMVLLLASVVRGAGVLADQKEILGDVFTVALICAVLLVFFAVIIWAVMKLLMLTQRYQTVINRLEILQIKLKVVATEASKKALVNQELKIVTRILGELEWKQWYGGH